MHRKGHEGFADIVLTLVHHESEDIMDKTIWVRDDGAVVDSVRGVDQGQGLKTLGTLKATHELRGAVLALLESFVGQDALVVQCPSGPMEKMHEAVDAANEEMHRRLPSAHFLH